MTENESQSECGEEKSDAESQEEHYSISCSTLVTIEAKIEVRIITHLKGEVIFKSIHFLVVRRDIRNG